VNDERTMPVDDVLDPSVLADLLELQAGVGDDTFVRSIVAEFATSSATLLDAMRQALTLEDREGLRRAAHKLKGSAGAISAREVMLLADALQLAAATAPWPAAGERVDVLAAALSRAHHALAIATA
jgi:HPt (histidine-containing phosphotransfer) domain-containing protein